MQSQVNASPARHHGAPLASSFYSTDEAAAALHISPQTLRAAVCRNGVYCGVRPIKRANRFLAWPAEQIDAIARGEVA